MPQPPFKLATSSTSISHGLQVGTVFKANRFEAESASPSDVSSDGDATGRLRLGQLNSHIHCSVLGTCLSTTELRKVMSRFVDVHGATDLDVHHDAVGHAADNGPIARALHKSLDQRHAATIARFSKARGGDALTRLWNEALDRGEVPGAYWAVLTHRDVTTDLRQQVFGDVHMLSHLVGSSNRASLRQLADLESENAALRERLDRQQERSQSAFDERDHALNSLRQALADVEGRSTNQGASIGVAGNFLWDASATASTVALQTERRERAELAAAAVSRELTRMGEVVEYTRDQVVSLQREIAALEDHLKAGTEKAGPALLAAKLNGSRILYVGGRPSSTPTIRDLVQRHRGEFQRHDGLEDRKGLLAGAVAWASLVVFPVDCVDHDSANNLKRLSSRHGIPFLALRSAGIASFVAAMTVAVGTATLTCASPKCSRHS